MIYIKRVNLVVRKVKMFFSHHDSSDDESSKENKHTNGEENKHTKEEEHQHNEPAKVEETTEKHTKTDSGEIQKESFLYDVTQNWRSGLGI